MSDRALRSTKQKSAMFHVKQNRGSLRLSRNILSSDASDRADMSDFDSIFVSRETLSRTNLMVYGEKPILPFGKSMFMAKTE